MPLPNPRQFGNLSKRQRISNVVLHLRKRLDQWPSRRAIAFDKSCALGSFRLSDSVQKQSTWLASPVP